MISTKKIEKWTERWKVHMEFQYRVAITKLLAGRLVDNIIGLLGRLYYTVSYVVLII